MDFKISLWILLIGFGLVYTSPTATKSNSDTEEQISECNPLVIAHRGASGYVPEHTLGSYTLALTMGADYIEPDLVMTMDGHLIIRHDNELGQTTDIAEHPEFADRRRNQTVDGIELNGWFTEDFNLTEIKTLRAIERIPAIRPGNARMDKSYTVMTFQDIIDLAKNYQNVQKRVIGIYPEIKHSTHFRRLGLPMEQLVIDTLHNNGYIGSQAPVYIQSFEVNNLKELKKITDIRLLQLYDSKSSQPFDQKELGTGLTYGDMATPEGLKEVAKYAYAVGPDKSYIIPRDSNNRLGTVTSFVEDAHNVGLKVHPYTFRAENYFLPANFQSGDTDSSAIGDLKSEIEAYLAAGIDGLFSDQADIPVRLRASCSK